MMDCDGCRLFGGVAGGGVSAPPSSFCHVVAVVSLRGTFPPRAGGNPAARPPWATMRARPYGWLVGAMRGAIFLG